MRREVGREARTGSVGWDGRGRREERKEEGRREGEGRKGGGKEEENKCRKGAGGREGEIKQWIEGKGQRDMHLLIAFYVHSNFHW